LSAGPALKWIRERYLVERAGYVQHQPAPKSRKMVAAFVGAVLVPALFFLEPKDGMLLGATGILSGVLVATLGRSSRFLIGGALMAQGLLTLVSGTVVFARFMRQPA
jgi:hypothetical protein